MRARLALATCSIVFCFAAEALAAPFCVVTNFGTRCYYYSRSECQEVARQDDGACVVNTEEAGPGAAGSPDARPYADVAGAFQRGLEASRRELNYDQDRSVSSSASAPEAKPLTFNDVVIQFLQDGVPRAVPETRLPQGVIDRCDHFREYANQNRALADQRTFWTAIGQYDICLRSGVIPVQ